MGIAKHRILWNQRVWGHFPNLFFFSDWNTEALGCFCFILFVCCQFFFLSFFHQETKSVFCGQQQTTCFFVAQVPATPRALLQAQICLDIFLCGDNETQVVHQTWLKSLSAVSNVNVFATQDKHDSLHRYICYSFRSKRIQCTCHTLKLYATLEPYMLPAIHIHCY